MPPSVSLSFNCITKNCGSKINVLSNNKMYNIKICKWELFDTCTAIWNLVSPYFCLCFSWKEKFEQQRDIRWQDWRCGCLLSLSWRAKIKTERWCFIQFFVVSVVLKSLLQWSIQKRCLWSQNYRLGQLKVPISEIDYWGLAHHYLIPKHWFLIMQSYKMRIFSPTCTKLL